LGGDDVGDCSSVFFRMGELTRCIYAWSSVSDTISIRSVLSWSRPSWLLGSVAAPQLRRKFVLGIVLHPLCVASLLLASSSVCLRTGGCQSRNSLRIDEAPMDNTKTKNIYNLKSCIAISSLPPETIAFRYDYW